MHINALCRRAWSWHAFGGMARASQDCAPVSKVSARVQAPARETLPQVGRRPRMPQKLAGTRTLPPVSLPIAKSTEPSATATCAAREGSLAQLHVTCRCRWCLPL